MAPDDIPVANAASASARGTNSRSGRARRAVGPEDEVRGGHEAPSETLAGKAGTPARAPDRMLSDPPIPPGTPPTRPDPDSPPPIEEPPGPIPVPPDLPPPPVIEPPPPIVAAPRARG